MILNKKNDFDKQLRKLAAFFSAYLKLLLSDKKIPIEKSSGSKLYCKCPNMNSNIERTLALF